MTWSSNETQSGRTLTFALDPLQSRVNIQSDGSSITTDHYVDSADSPAWASTGSTAWIRNVTGPDGSLAAPSDQNGSVTLELANLHGDIVATAEDNSDADGMTSYYETDEYGDPRTAATSGTPYGWLGTRERSSDAFGGVVIKGARLYLSAIGRFLSVDPLPTGNANSYIYPDDPINLRDTWGQFSVKWYWNKVDFYLNRSETLARN